LCTWVKLLTDVQILGCELHKIRLELWRCPRPRSRYKGERRKGRGRKGLGIGKGDWDKREGPDGVGRDGKERERYGKGRMGKGREGAGKGERVGKGEGELDMDICPRAPSS